MGKCRRSVRRVSGGSTGCTSETTVLLATVLKMVTKEGGLGVGVGVGVGVDPVDEIGEEEEERHHLHAHARRAMRRAAAVHAAARDRKLENGCVRCAEESETLEDKDKGNEKEKRQ